MATSLEKYICGHQNSKVDEKDSPAEKSHSGLPDNLEGVKFCITVVTIRFLVSKPRLICCAIFGDKNHNNQAKIGTLAPYLREVLGAT